jgi:hypothetical protein
MTRIAMPALAGVLLLGGCSMKEDMAAGDKAVAAFHQALDAGRFQQIWAQSAADMKATTAQDRLVALLDTAHRNLGRFKSGSQIGFNDNVSTGGHMLTVNYQAQYERGPATEQFVFRIDGGRALLAGYRVNSDALVVRQEVPIH